MRFPDLLKTLMDADVSEFHETSEYRYTYKGDVLLQVVVADDEEGRRTFQEPWTDKFPDKTAEACDVTIEYGGVPVHTFMFVVTDGGRHYIPLPSSGTPPKIDKLQYSVAQILDGPRGSLEDGLRIAGIKVVDAHERSLNF